MTENTLIDFTSRFHDENHADGVARDAILCILDSFSKQLDDNFISALEVPFSTQLAMMKFHKMVELATLQHDGTVSAEDGLEKMTPDGEPMPSSIDSWARGTVATRKVVQEDNSYGRIPGLASSTPSVSSYRSSATGKSRNTTGSTRSRTSGKSASSGFDKSGQIFPLDDEAEGDFANLGATAPLFDMLQKQKRNKAKMGGAMIESDEKTEFDILQDQLDKAAKDLKGKKFVLDRYGKPVIMGKVAAETLPPFSLSLELDANKINRARNSSNAADNKRVVRVAGSRTMDEESFKATTSLATTLSGLDNIQKVGAGVVVRSSKDARKGDPVMENPDHMSRKTYMEKAAKANKTVTGGSTLGGDSSMFSKSQFSTASGDTRGTGPAGRSSMLLPQSMKNIDYLPEVDKFEGSRSIVSAVDTHDLSDEELGLGPILSPGGGAPRISSLHQKPSDAQRANIDLISGSPNNGKPRDRDLPKNMRPVSERKHLPAPPLGQTTGHGLAGGSLMSPNSLTSNDDWTGQWKN